jgi:hypothetical protein
VAVHSLMLLSYKNMHRCVDIPLTDRAMGTRFIPIRCCETSANNQCVHVVARLVAIATVVEAQQAGSHSQLWRGQSCHSTEM